MLTASPRRAEVSWEMCALEAVGFLVSHNGSNFTWACLKKAYLFTVFTLMWRCKSFGQLIFMSYS